MSSNAADTFTLGLVQMRCEPSPAVNLDKAVAAVHKAAAAGAQIVCLPELFRSPYFCQRQDPALFDLAEPIPGPSTERLARAAKEAGVVVVGSLFERRALEFTTIRPWSSTPTAASSGVYRKMHIPDDPLYYEKYYFTPGDMGFRAFDTHFGRIGVLVCWDQWFPEAARLTALHGAEVLLYPTAIGWHPREKAEVGASQREAWELIQRAHAVANGVFVAAVNRVGHEGAAGERAGVLGVVVRVRPVRRGAGAGAPRTATELVIAQCDRRRLEDVRRNWPFLRDRRIDAYGDLTKRMIG